MARLFTVLVLVVVSMTAGARLALASSYAEAIDSFARAGESAEYFKTAYGYAVFPTIGKGGIGIGGTMAQVTLGLQLGGQAYSQIIFFKDENAFNSFTSGNFEFSAQATAVAITAGVSAEANTGGGMGAGASGGRNDATTAHAGYRKGMAVFTIAKGGLMYEVSLGGQKFSYQPL